MKIVCIFLCLTVGLFSKSVEYFEDWNSSAIGEPSLLSKALTEKGYTVRYWDWKSHAPHLFTWKKIHDWQSFKHYFGFDLPIASAFNEETAYLVFANLGPLFNNLDLSKLPKQKLILFALEPPTVQPELYDPKILRHFSKIYTWNDDLIDNVRFFKCYPFYKRDRIEQLVPYEKKKFLTLIAARLSSPYPQQLYSEREQVIHFFEDNPQIEFDLWGRYWQKRNFKNYKGEIAGSFSEKLEVLKNYKFAFAYENTQGIKGYITEKLFDCFAAGVVPIYWGASNVADYIPADCFIDRRQFQTMEELLVFLQAMTQEEWEGYVARAEQFLRTDTANLFTYDNYLRTICDALN